MKHVLNHKFRWLTFLTLILAAIGFGSLSLSDAWGKQRRTSNVGPVSGAAPAGVERVASYNTAATATTFSAPIELIRPVSPIFFQQGGEPEIKVDLFGNVYVTAIQGVPGGVDLWKSIDKGGSFVYLGEPDGAQDKCLTLPQCAGLGGGDDQIDVSPGGYLYISSLWLGNVTISTSMDGGTGGVQPGQAWQVNGAAAAVVADDRQWIAAYGPQTLNMTYRQAPGTGDLFFVKSTDAGKTFGAPVLVKSGNSTEGNLVVDPYNGNLYTTTIPGTNLTDIHLLKSTDGGATWTETTAYAGAAGTDPAHKFTILAVDRGGNLHLVFSRSSTNGYHVYLTSSSNGGTTWLPAVQVDSGSGNTTTAVMPWVVAGSPGVVDITWLGSSGASPSATPFNWQVFYTQTTNALSGSPLFNQVQVTTNAIHDTNICFNGSGCTGTNNRDLLEYYTMTLDSEGQAHIAFPDSVNACPAATCKTNAWYTKQTSGTNAYAPPAPPAPSTFALNIPLSGGAGAEPSIWVDTHNCIYVTAPGGLKIWRSVNNGASFLPPVNPGGTGLTGGDEDIVTLPKADGSRSDQVYFADLGISSVHIRKSTDGGAVYFAPGTGGSAGEVSISSDRQWLAADRIGPDQDVYLLDHEFTSEVIRISSTTNDAPWVTASGMTDPELSISVPNTNPGPIFVDKTLHTVYGVFTASIPTTNLLNPPFGKLLNIWDAVGNPPAATGGPAGPFVNHPIFKGVIDSPTTPAPPAGTTTFGTNCANIFPAGDVDLAGNIYVAWSMNNARTNEFSIWFASSHDKGLTYYGPYQISQGPGTAIFPWVSAGDNGRVDIVWYQSSTVGNSNTMPPTATWNVMFGQSLNGNAREPVFAVSQVSDHVMHNGPISTGGLIGTSDRSLLDFFEVSVGPDGLANIIYADNGSTATHAEYARQNSGPLAKANPTFPTCLPPPPVPTAVVSRKTHGGAGDFDVDLLPPAPGIECRTGGASGDFKMVITFPLPVTVASASVTSGTGTVSSTVVSGNIVTVNLTGVTNAQRLTVTLNTVADANGSGNVPINMAVLAGDTTADTFVNSGDIAQTKSQSGQVVTVSNFREDVTIDGNLNSGDIALVKSKSGTALP